MTKGLIPLITLLLLAAPAYAYDSQCVDGYGFPVTGGACQGPNIPHGETGECQAGVCVQTPEMSDMLALAFVAMGGVMVARRGRVA